MDFDLSDEQRMLQETVAGFIENECPLPRLRELFDDEVGFDPVFWKGLAELGVAGIHLPGEYGGSEMEILDLAVVAETLGAHAAPAPLLSHALASLAILEAGNDEQKRRLLPGLASGETLATVALAEEGRGWQPEQWSIAPGGTISGTKEMVEFGEHADLFVIGLEGGRFAVAPRNAEGIEVQRIEAADRTRRVTRVGFADTPVEVLEAGNDAVAARVRDVGLVLLAADAFGGATKLVEISVEYAKNREQFGVTIGHFQALKHQLANMAVEIEPSRALYWYAAHAIDHIPDQASRTAAIAKSHITERFQQVARDATEAFGGIGYTWEGDTQILFKRAMFDRVFLGTPWVHQERAAEMAGW
ncbi:MAG: acyl-CoA dehydrogenase [Deltaproteobacteria bacterium]|nr:acyl-CoA dehydrogenase [Deltaproteobacteria bacterium]